MEARALRKVFISIKGYYYQAEVMGQAITWVVPHDFVIEKVPDVDYRVMRTFTEFYVTLMGFINFKLFSSLNLSYPPQVASSLTHDQQELLAGYDDQDLVNEYVAALNRPLVKSIMENNDPEAKTDDFEELGLTGDDAEVKSCVGMTFAQTMKLQKLFEGLKFFINREVPRESLVFVIRSFGGDVSYDKMMFVGATYDESDQRITHQIIDRDVISNKYMTRFYIQPQWVFDCINARTLLPVQDYFPGVALPPHLSPFVAEVEGDYISPEAQRLRDLQSGTVEGTQVADDEDEEESDEEIEEPAPKKKKVVAQPQEVKTEVKKGKAVKENKAKKAVDTEAEEKRLAVMMIPKKKKRLYDKIMYGKKRKVRENEVMTKKRQEFDWSSKNKKKSVAK
jgi:pescadillo protein